MMLCFLGALPCVQVLMQLAITQACGLFPLGLAAAWVYIDNPKQPRFYPVSPGTGARQVAGTLQQAQLVLLEGLGP